MKKLLAGASLLVIVIIAAVGVFLATLDLNEYQADVINVLETLTGRKVQILGDIGLKPAFTPTLRIKGFQIGNPAWATDPYLLEADHVFLKIAIAPIFAGEIELRRVLLEGIRINLESNAGGDNTWQFVSETEQNDSGNDLPGVNIESLKITDVRINYLAPESPLHQFDLNRLSLHRKDADSLVIEAKARFQEEDFSISGTTSLLRKLLFNQDFAFALRAEHRSHTASINGKLLTPLEAPRFEAEVTANTDNLGKLLALADIDIPLREPLEISTNIAAHADAITLDKLSLETGDSRLSGKVKIDLRSPRPAIDFQMLGELVDLGPLLTAEDAAGSTPRKRAFPDAPLPFSALSKASINGTINITTLKLAMLSIDKLQSTILSEGVVIRLSDTNGTIAGGQFSLAGNLDMTAADNPSVEASVNNRNLKLAELIIAENGQVAKSGTMNLDIKIHGRGNSLADIMATSNGFVHLDITNAQFENSAATLATGDLLVNLLNGLNPLSNDSATRIECAVIRLPIKNGVAKNETGVGIRTAELNILGGGQVDLRSEKIAFEAKPKPRKGMGLNVASLADFVGVGGTLMDPHPTTDTEGLATAGVKVGAALATGGLSLLAEGLFDRASSDVDVCAVARGEASIQAAKSSQNEAKPNVLESTGKKLKGVFNGIFGK